MKLFLFEASNSKKQLNDADKMIEIIKKTNL